MPASAFRPPQQAAESILLSCSSAADLQAWPDRAFGFGWPLRGYPGAVCCIVISSREPCLREIRRSAHARWDPLNSAAPHMPVPALISVLARSLLAGSLELEEVRARAARTLGRPWAWLPPLADRYVTAFAGRTRPRRRDVVRFLLDDADLHQALARHRAQISIAEWIAEPQRMQPVASAQSWRLPRIQSAGDLADWLSLTPAALAWFADLKGLAHRSRNPRLQHYRYRVLMKPSGGVRLIESPKSRLKELQERVLFHILNRVPAHPASHGFVKGRSIVSFAAPHTGKQMLLRLDLEDFFPGFPAARVQAVFRTLGYPDEVASLLAGICTNSVPRDVWNPRPLGMHPARWQELRQLYASPHLPQGASTSPALANIMAYRLDCRLQGLAKSAAAAYTRYADDLAFSGGHEFRRVVERFSAHAGAIALEEGFSINHHKTRIMRPSLRQHLAGLVVNQKVGIPRREWELLEAILTNCVHLGPGSQNRQNLPDFRAHLQGRLGFATMVDRVKGGRLAALFALIDWSR